MKVQNKPLTAAVHLWSLLIIIWLCWLVVSWLIADNILYLRVKEFTQQKSSEIELQAETIAENIDIKLNDLHGIPTLVARDPDVLSNLSRFSIDARPSALSLAERKKVWTSDVRLNVLNRYLKLVSTTMVEDAVFIMNLAGDCVAASNYENQNGFIGSANANREYFQQAMAGKQGYQFAMGKQSNIPGLFFSAPIILNGRIVGVVAAKANMPTLLPQLKNRYAFISDEYGVIILASDPKFTMHALPGAGVSRLPVVERMLRYKLAEFPVLSIDSWSEKWGTSLQRLAKENQPFLLTDRALKEHNIKVHVYRPVPEIAALTEERLRLCLLLGISGLVLLLLIGMRLTSLRTRKYAEQLRHANALKYQMLFESTRDALMILSPPSWSFTGANQATLQLFGAASEQQLIARMPSDISPDVQPDGQNSSQKMQQVIEIAIREGAHFFEWEHRRLDGQTFTAEVLLTCMGKEEELCILASVRDISERKQNENQLQESEQRLLDILNLSPVAVRISGNLDQQAEFYNEKYAEFIKNLTLMGEDLNNYYSKPENYQGIVEQLASGKAVINYQLELTAADGSTVWALASYMSIHYHGTPAILSWYYDITKLKKTEEALLLAMNNAEAANLAKSAFLANMSHEIRTPMNGVVGMVDILQQTQLTAEQQRMLNTIQDSSLALLYILNDILDFSKIEADMLVLESMPTRLREVAEEVALLLTAMSSRKSIDLLLYVSPKLPAWIDSDPIRLRQIFFNLLGNAIKFTSSNQNLRGKVSLRVEPGRLKDDSPGLLIRIQDNGIGMTEATLDKLFKPFTQADTSTARKFGGTGLGLSIVRRLIDMMHGQITVQSTPGTGSEFTVLLPLQLATDRRMQVFEPSLEGVHVYCLYRDKELIQVVQDYLVAAGAEVTLLVDPGQLPQLKVSAQPCAVLLAQDMLETVLPEGTAVVRLAHKSAYPASHEISVRAEPLFYSELIHGVAIVSGLLVMPFEQNQIIYRSPARSNELGSVLNSRYPILLAEDNETNQEVMTEQLRMLGYTADIAADGVMALKMWQSGKYALLLTDCHMPNMDGFELTAAIRQAETSGTRIPIIAVTANTLQGEAERCMACGMDDYLGKPLRLKQLELMLNKWLHRQKYSKEADIPPRPKPGKGLENPPVADELPMQLGVWDEKMLTKLVGDKPDMINRMLKKFLSQADQQVNEIVGAAASGNIDTLTEVAHKLKSAARTVGTMQLGQLCQEMEAAGYAGDMNTCGELVKQLQPVYAEAARKIEKNVQLVQVGQ